MPFWTNDQTKTCIDIYRFHTCQNIKIPENVKLIRIPPYTPELNPAEKVWKWMKDRVAMKMFSSTLQLQQKITQLAHRLESKLIKSITGYDFYIKLYNNVFKD